MAGRAASSAQVIDRRDRRRRQRAKTSLADGGEDRPELRALDERGLAADRYLAVEYQDDGGRNKTDAERAERSAAQPVNEPGLVADGLGHHHAREFSERGADEEK